MSGTLVPSGTETEIVAGAETLIITLTNDTWDPTIGADNAKTTALINGIDSAQSEAAKLEAIKQLGGSASNAELEGLVPHLAGAAATIMMERGVHPSIVSRSLGHASGAFTMMVFGHVRDEMLDQAAEALGDAHRRAR